MYKDEFSINSVHFTDLRQVLTCQHTACVSKSDQVTFIIHHIRVSSLADLKPINQIPHELQVDLSHQGSLKFPENIIYRDGNRDQRFEGYIIDVNRADIVLAG